MADVFVSYAREDQNKARNLAQVLEDYGWSIWWDTEIYGGQFFDEVIAKALDNAKCVVVLWSSNSITSRWVKAEATVAFQKETLVPAKIENHIDPPLPFGLLHTVNLTEKTARSMIRNLTAF